MSPRLFPQLFWNFDGLFKTRWYARRIVDVTAEKRAAAVEFEIEIPFIGFRLDEKLHATVFPDFVHVVRSHAADKLVPHMKNAVNALRIIKKPRRSLRSVGA